LLADVALTNDAPTVQGLFPGLTIVASSNYFVTVYVTNVTPFFVNYPWDPVGTPAHLAFTTNVVPTAQQRFNHTFGNLLVLTNIPTPPYWAVVPMANIPAVNGQATVTIQNLVVGTAAQPWGPVGSISITTNASFTTFLTNAVVGEYLVLPPNLCSAAIVESLFTNVVSFTNLIFSVTNSPVTSTNANGGTNAGTLLFVEKDQITYFTNHAFVILPVTCPAANVALYQGVEKISFVRRDYDSLLGRSFSPTTNFYILNSITNSTLLPQTVQRSIPAPDILFSAADLEAGPAQPPFFFEYLRFVNFNSANTANGAPGPGTIEAATLPTVIFNNVGPSYANFSPNAFFISSAQASQFSLFAWASFDGTTNPPTVYPNGTSIANLENQILIGVSPGALPDGKVGAPYNAGSPTFTASGGQPPYTWSLAPLSPGLPPFVLLTSDGTLHPVGVPTQPATYDFTIRLTDAGGRTVDRAYSITIDP
jgi:hypothetical protein